MKTLRKNDSRYRIELIGTGLGIWVSTMIEEDTDHTCKQPNGLGRAFKLSINVLVSLIIVVSHGDAFTPVAHTQPSSKFISQD